MSENLQTERVIKIETALGKDALLLSELQGAEYISDLFEFDLTLHSENHEISFDEIIGTKATIKVRLDDNSERIFNGYISSFQHQRPFVLEEGEKASIISQYSAKLVPWLWTLSLNTDCRIFQEKSVPEIVREVLQEHQISKFEFRLSKSYDAREYCVQYRESDFNFVSRLLEEEGIFYFFEHRETDHVLVVADDLTQIKPSKLQPQVNFTTLIGEDESRTFVTELIYNQQMLPDSFELRDFNFKNPSLNLKADIKGKGFEVYDYPGEFDKHAEGSKLVKVRYEAYQCQKEMVTAITNGRGFEAGFRFALKNHPRNSFNKDYSILKVEHQASQQTYRSSTSSRFFYESKLTCIPHQTPYRPPRKTPIPKIVGTQTAIVVGPKGEEIHVDNHGRVKVHFHWDRVEKNAKSSCWIRVSQPWAGTTFGGITIPRIGQEVIVDFLEGNPDNPIITGRVYNGESRVPYELPANKAHSGWMSRSTKGGGNENFNGIRMNDEIGAEKMEFQAEKDQEILVKNNNDKVVGNCETTEIGVNRTEKVGNNEGVEIGNNRQHKVEKNDTLTVGQLRTHSVGINEMINVGTAQEVSIGAVQLITVGMTQMINVGLKQKVNAGKEISLKAPNILLEATESIQIKCGAGIIQIDAAGNITIKSPLVKINC